MNTHILFKINKGLTLYEIRIKDIMLNEISQRQSDKQKHPQN